jgi:hypothetical protein
MDIIYASLLWELFLSWCSPDLVNGISKHLLLFIIDAEMLYLLFFVLLTYSTAFQSIAGDVVSGVTN